MPRLQDTEGFILIEFGRALRACDASDTPAQVAVIRASQKRLSEIGQPTSDANWMLSMVVRDVTEERVKAAAVRLEAARDNAARDRHLLEGQVRIDNA